MIYFLVDIYSHTLRGVYPSREDAEHASDNTQAECVIYEVPLSGD